MCSLPNHLLPCVPCSVTQSHANRRAIHDVKVGRVYSLIFKGWVCLEYQANIPCRDISVPLNSQPNNIERRTVPSHFSNQSHLVFVCNIAHCNLVVIWACCVQLISCYGQNELKPLAKQYAFFNLFQRPLFSVLSFV
jgi:hypothetical protein